MRTQLFISGIALFLLACPAPPELVEDERACTEANNCQLVDGAAECLPGYTWLNPDGASGDYRCVPIADASSPVDAGQTDLGSADAAAPDSARVDAGVVDASRPDAAAPDQSAGDAARPDSAAADTAAGTDAGVVVDAADPRDSGSVGDGGILFELPYPYPGLAYGQRLVDDFNGDARLDAISIEVHDPTGQVKLRVSLDDGSGTFVQSYEAAFTGYSGYLMGSGDFDGDQSTDLLLSVTNGGLFLFWGQGDGLFVQEQDPLGFAVSAVADFDNDGMSDLLSTRLSYGNNAVEVHRSNGDGSFDLEPISSMEFSAVRYGDMNNDGRLDVVVQRDYPRELWTYLQQPNGSFVLVAPAPACPVCDALGDFSLVDLNADGRADVVAAYRDPSDDVGVLVLLTQVDQSLVQSTFVPMIAPQQFFSGDVDGDGFEDLVGAVSAVPNISGNEGIVLLHGDGLGGLSGPHYYLNKPGARALSLLFDHDGDGRRDLLFDGSVVFRGGAGRELRAPLLSPWPLPGSAFNYGKRFALRDMNGDGRLDGFATYRPSFNVGYLGADYRFSSSLTCSDLFEGYLFPNADLWARDLTGDGVADLYVGNSDGMHVMVGSGGCNFTGPTLAIPDAAYAAFVEINADPYPDAVWSGIDRVYCALSTGPATWGAPVESVLSQDVWGSINADFDGDGDVDLMGQVYDQPVLVPLFGDGAGAFLEGAVISFADVGGLSVGGVNKVDFDRDGDVDLLVYGSGQTAVYVLVNDGSGAFQRQTVNVEMPGASFPYYAVADFTGDGHDELLHYVSQEARVYRLDGSLSPTVLARFTTYDTMWTADVDGDGDADMVFIDEYDGTAIFAVAPNYSN